MSNIAIIRSAAALLLLVLAIGGGCSRRHEGAPLAKLNVAEVLAAETAKLLGKHGQIVLVSYNGRGDDFQQAIQKLGDFSVTMETLPTEETRSVCHISAEYFLALLAKFPNADAIVSLVGVPEFVNDLVPPLPDKRPKFLALSTCLPGLQPLFAQDALQLAIVPRADSPTSDTKVPGSGRALFDLYFETLTPAHPAPAAR